MVCSRTSTTAGSPARRRGPRLRPWARRRKGAEDRRGPRSRHDRRAEELGERREEREGEKKEERGKRMADKWAPLPHGVHVSETGHQNSRMANCERF